MVVRLTIPAAWSIAVVCTVAISCWPSVLRTMSRPLDERRIAEAALPLPWPSGPDRGGQRLFRVDQLGLRLGQGRGQRRDRFTGPGHGRPPSPGHRSSPRPISSAWPRTPWPIASLASSGIKALSSLFARSWSRKASRVLRNSAANSAQEFDALMSTMRMASMRGRGGSALIRWGVFARLDAAPELLLGRDQDAQIERVHGDGDLDPFAAAGDDRQHRRSADG